MAPADYVVPAGWKTPPVLVMQYIDEASKDYAEKDDPDDADQLKYLLIGIINKEDSSWRGRSAGSKHGGNNKTYAKSWAKYKDLKIPGSSTTWGQKFGTPERWRPYGLCQLNPYHIFGVPGGLKASEPLSRMLDWKKNIRCAARVLATYRKSPKSDGTWGGALRMYNGSSQYHKEVAQNITDWKNANNIG